MSGRAETRKKKSNSMDAVFAGYHCKDCIYYSPRQGGGGACYFRGGIIWPGNETCTNFSQ